MQEQLKLDYFYGNEADNFCFYKIPKVLFTKASFQDLSTDAKVLYGLMLDMMSSSRANRWVDSENRVFIQFSIQRAMAYLGCGKAKAIKLFAELDSEKGIGLIERVNRGQGKADIIYVKSFAISREAEDNARIIQLKKRRLDDAFGPSVQKSDIREKVDENYEVVRKPDHFSTNSNAFRVKAVRKSNRSDKQTGSKPEPQEVCFSNPSNNNYINNRYKDIISPSDPVNADDWNMAERQDEKKKAVIRQLQEQIRYNDLMKNDFYLMRKGIVDGIVNMIADIVVFPKKTGTERINGREVSDEELRDKLLNINDDLLEYVLHNFKENSTKIRNKRAYLLTALYNAADEIDFGYSAQVNYDLYGGGM